MLILIRHGQSIWNAENLFTGWRDIGLSPQGEAEARRTGERLSRAGVQIDDAWTSALKRAQDSCAIILRCLGQEHLPIAKTSALNERDYGILSGMNKDDARAQYGADQVHQWRRSYQARPPQGESLADTAARVLPYYREHIEPHWLAGKVILIVAHGNSLRALLMMLEQLSPEEIVKREIATGAPLIYRRDRAGQTVKDDAVC